MADMRDVRKLTQLTLTSLLLAGESHCFRLAPGLNGPFWDCSPLMSQSRPPGSWSVMACGRTRNALYDSRQKCGRRAPQGRLHKPQQSETLSWPQAASESL